MTKILQWNAPAEQDSSLAPSERETLLSEAELDQVVGAQNRGRPTVSTTGGITVAELLRQ
jgi:hypothetical protein